MIRGPEAESIEVGKVEGAFFFSEKPFGKVAEGISTLIAKVVRIRSATDAEGVQNEPDDAFHMAGMG